MIKAFSNHLSLKLVNANIISQEDMEVYSYGLFVINMNLIILISVFTLGLLLKEVPLTCLLTFMFISIRCHSGGYHANTLWKCWLLSCLMELLVVIFATILPNYLDCRYLLLLLWCSYFILFKVGSINSIKNPKPREKHEASKRYVRVITSLYVFITTLGILFWQENIEIWLVSIFVHFSIALSFLSVLFQRRKGL